MIWLAVYVKFCIAERYWELGAARASQVSNDGLSPAGLVSRDPSKAVRYYEMAADRGNVDAVFNLGVMYNTGDKVSKDPSKAHVVWFRFVVFACFSLCGWEPRCNACH